MVWLLTFNVIHLIAVFEQHLHSGVGVRGSGPALATQGSMDL
jgi:hypothetical protein